MKNFAAENFFDVEKFRIWSKFRNFKAIKISWFTFYLDYLGIFVQFLEIFTALQWIFAVFLNEICCFLGVDLEVRADRVRKFEA